MSLANWRRPLALAALVSLLLLGLGELLIHQLQQRRLEEQRGQVASLAGELRANLLNELNGTLHLASGLVSYLQSHDGQLDERELEPWLRALIAQGRHIRNIALAPGNRIAYVYPLAGNQGALGLYYPDNAQQWPAVQRTIESRQGVLDGPLQLRQGGIGLAYRVPVFLDDGRYWGLVSTLIDIPSLLAELGPAARQRGLEIALYTHPEQPDAAPMFGSARWREQAQSRLDMPVPGGHWLLLARSVDPLPGASALPWLHALAAALCLAMGALLAFALRAASAQRQARAALDESRQRFAQAFVTAPQGMALLTPQGDWLAVNHQLCLLLDRSASELERGSLFDRLPEAEHGRARLHLHQARNHPQQWPSLLLDAFDRPIDCQLSAAWVETEPPYLILQCQDIRELKRVERLKSEFVATVSHELRTPLTAIAGALGLVNGGALGPLPAAMRELLAIAEQNCERLTLLINDLLDMEKLEAGKMSFELRRVDLAAQLREGLDSLRAYAAPLGVELRLREGPPVEVEVDPLRLQQVLGNLLSNAAKFSPRGATVEVDWQCRDGHVRVNVRDQGPGIDEDFRPRLFAKFAQADASTTRQVGGTGLGLAISRRLIERMHGQIGCDSQPGQGSTFWFELPGLPPAA